MGIIKNYIKKGTMLFMISIVSCMQGKTTLLMNNDDQKPKITSDLNKQVNTNDDNKEKEDELIVTPWEVKSKTAIDYMKLINKFGCDPIDGKLLKRFEEVTNFPVHPWLRRGIFFSQKDLSKVLDYYEQKKQIYIYTGRGPSTESMHLGHLIPFLFTKYLQDALDAIVVIQLSDDEKYYFRKGDTADKDLNYFVDLSRKNALDIMACGYNLDKTYIFSNTEQLGGIPGFYETAARIANSVNINTMKSIYGLNDSCSVGQFLWPSLQCVPAFSQAFPQIFGDRKVPCLVPMAIDQDPYFRMARDFGGKKNPYLKPATIHTKFLVALLGINAKMSSNEVSTENATIFLSDNPVLVRNKIIKYAFSGGKDTLKDHKKYGGNLYTDVSYQYLLYFMEKDDDLSKIAAAYRKGEMSSQEIKTIMAETVVNLLNEHNKRKEKMTPLLDQFFNINRKFDHSFSKREKIKLKSDDVYNSWGINFDITFGNEPSVVE